MGSGTLYYRYDGGTVTVGIGHALSNLGNIIVDKIGQARNMQLLCDIGIGTVTITYMRVMP